MNNTTKAAANNAVEGAGAATAQQHQTNMSPLYPNQAGFKPGEPTAVGAVIMGEGSITYNEGRELKKVTIQNTGDRPIQVGSHFHLFEVNRYLDFDRDAAYGCHLNIPATTAIRFEPGDSYVYGMSHDILAAVLEVASGEKFEIRIDGVLRERFTRGEDAFIEKSVKLTDALGKEKDELRVTLVFPSHSVGSLEYVAIDDGAYFRAPEYKTKMLFIGDSITQGHNSKYDSLSYAWRTVHYFDADAVINGIGGAYYMPESFDKIDFDPDTVILAYGTNDACKFDYAVMKEKTVGYLDLVKENYGDKNVIVISPIWRARDTGAVMGEDFESKRKMVEDESEKRGFYVVSGLKLVPPLADLYADKYLHPNDLGFGVYAENLIKEISNIVK